jgi:hypothetical protein
MSLIRNKYSVMKFSFSSPDTRSAIHHQMPGVRDWPHLSNTSLLVISFLVTEFSEHYIRYLLSLVQIQLPRLVTGG